MMMSADRVARLEDVARQIRECDKCRLVENTTNAVPGYGDASADILFIGEAPGAEEDKQGLPFVGRSGKYLDYLLDLIGMKREDVFIANMVKHRPPKNRDPQTDELVACKPFLDMQFEIIDPLVVVTLGRFSMSRYFTGDVKISRIHGQARYDDDRAYYPLYHPAAALRNPNLRHDMEADIKRIPSVVEEMRKRRGGVDDVPPAADDDDETPTQLSLF
jgi:uracil-DNA glycosylase